MCSCWRLLSAPHATADGKETDGIGDPRTLGHAAALGRGPGGSGSPGVLEERGSLARTRRHGAVTWGLKSSGLAGFSGRAARAMYPRWRMRRGTVRGLNRTAAGQEIDRFLQCPRQRGRRDRVARRDPGVGSDAWFELGERLHRDCRRVGSATYCLREWAEPDDARPDVDDRHDPADEGLTARAGASCRSTCGAAQHHAVGDAGSDHGR